MDASTYLRDALLGWVKGAAFPAAPANLYLALYNGDPGRTGTGGTDVTTTIRAAGRVAIAASGWSAISTDGTARVISNSGLVGFGNAAGAATITHAGLWTAPSGGNFIAKATLATSRSILAGQGVAFQIGDLVLRIL